MEPDQSSVPVPRAVEVFAERIVDDIAVPATATPTSVMVRQQKVIRQ